MSVKKMLSFLVLGATLAATPVWSAEATGDAKTVDLGKLSCKDLMSGDDTDRSVTTAFFHGYFAGKKSVMTVNLQELSATSDKVKDYCLSNPTSTVMDAFAKSGN